MPQYHEQKPPHARVKTGRVAGVPNAVEPDPTPMPEPPMVRGEEGREHLDIEATLRDLYQQLYRVEKQTKERFKLTPDDVKKLRESGVDFPFLDDYQQKLERAQKIWIPISLIAGILTTVFSVGVAWTVFMGANATDEEVLKFLDDVMIEHNGGVDPKTKNGTGVVGHHPDIRDAIHENTTKVGEVQASVNHAVEVQRKLDKRSEYQFELGRWQAKVLEAKQKRRKPPKKPPRLDDLERELMLGDYR